MSATIDFPVVIKRFDKILEKGLSKGLGKRSGKMCVEAALCAALGLPHGDDPPCVSEAVRAFKIALNDSVWSSATARAKGLRNLGIAQLGSKGVVGNQEFSKRLAIATVSQLLPIVLTDFWKTEESKYHADACSKVTILKEARSAAEAAAEAARPAQNAGWDVAWTARSAAGAARIVTKVAVSSAAWAARSVAMLPTDKYLLLSAEIALKILVDLKSPGAAWI